MSDNQRNRKRVLIVDLREIIADTLETIFGENGYDARAAYTAKDALKIAEAWEPDVLITDGQSLAKDLTALYRNCRVILISGWIIPETQLEARALGFEYFDKPVNPAILLKKIAAVLEQPLNDSSR